MPRLNVKVLGKTFVNGCGITAPRLYAWRLLYHLLFTMCLKFPRLLTYKKKT